MATKFEVSRVMHMSVTREYLLQFLDAHPNEYGAVVKGASSFTEAREFISNGPPSHPLGDCPEYTEEHGCPGHERNTDGND